MMRRAATALLFLAVTTSAMGEHVEAVWEQRFDVQALPEGAWTLKGGAALQEGALHTVSVPDATEASAASTDTKTAIPEAREGVLLRAEWSLVPVRIGGWGQDVRIESGPFVVEFTGERPTLNAKHGAKDVVVSGKETIVSCDFNRHSVFSWRINGKEQLDAPVAAWATGASTANLTFSDFKETNSESRWLWARLSKVTPDDVFPVRLSGWDDLPIINPGQPAPFLVSAVSPMEKVFREAADFRGPFERKARIAAAGRERESFQLVCMPIGQPLQNVTVTVSDLLHADQKTRLASDRVTWHPVGYVQTVQSNSAIRRVGWHWPDVLMPAEPFNVELGFVQPVWFTVDVPADAIPGVYRGLVDIRPEGQPSQTVGVELTVRSFSLPVRGKLKTAFCICPGMWEAWYKPDEVYGRLGSAPEKGHGALYTSYECEDVLPHEKWLEMYDFLLAHRLSPTVIYSGLKKGRSRVVPARADMEYCYERGMNATCLLNVDVLPGDAAEADKRMAEIEAWLKEWEGFAKEKNWPDFTWYVHGFDESEMRPNPETNVDPSIRRVNGMIGEKFPWLKRETANPLVEKHIGNFDIWTPLTAQLKEETLPAYRQRQEAGDQVWAYVCCGPGKPCANLFLDFPGVDPRILGWQFWQHRLTGFLYYLINLYDQQENWNTQGPKWPERPWNPFSYSTNSDGILIYPGPDATPLASTRLENLRDGIEDYEALAILADVTARVEQAGGHTELVETARTLLAVRPTVSTSWTEYAQEPEVISRERAEVDECIEACMKALQQKQGQ